MHLLELDVGRLQLHLDHLLLNILFTSDVVKSCSVTLTLIQIFTVHLVTTLSHLTHTLHRLGNRPFNEINGLVVVFSDLTST